MDGDSALGSHFKAAYLDRDKKVWWQLAHCCSLSWPFRSAT